MEKEFCAREEKEVDEITAEGSEHTENKGDNSECTEEQETKCESYQSSRFKRARVELIANPLHRHMYELIIRQLSHDGYYSAASHLTDITGVIPGYSYSDGNRLEKIVANGLNLESVSSRAQERFTTEQVVERYLDLSKLYIPLELCQSWKMHRRMWQLSEQFSSAPLDGLIRDLSFSADGNFVSCAGANGLAVVFALETLHDIMNLQRLRAINKDESEWRRELHSSSEKNHTPYRILQHSRSTTMSIYNRNDYSSLNTQSGNNIAHSRDETTSMIKLGSLSEKNKSENRGSMHDDSRNTIPLANVNEITELSIARHFTEHSQSVEFIRFHPYEPVLMSGAFDGEVIIRDYSLPSSSILLRVKDTFPARDACFHPSGEYTLLATDHYLPRLVNVTTGSILTPSPTYINFYANHHNNNTTTTTNVSNSSSSNVNNDKGSNSNNDSNSKNSSNNAKIDNSTSFNNTQAVQHSAALTSIAYDKEGRRFATASLDGSYMLYDAIGGKVISQIASAHSEMPVTSVRFSRSGNVVLTAGMDSIARLWDLRKLSNSLSVSAPVRTSAHNATSTNISNINSITRPAEVMAFGEPTRCEHRSIHATFNADESHVLCQSKSLTEVNSYCVYSGQVACQVTTHPTFIQRGMAASPVDNLFVTGGDDSRIRLWAPSWL